jgi:hypothetical protein
MKKDCFAFVSKYKCNALVTIDCKNCRFYKTKEQWRKEKENAKIRNSEKRIR